MNARKITFPLEHYFNGSIKQKVKSMDNSNGFNLQRFVAAQEVDFQQALSEIKKGRKRSHWMWYIFPQIQGLGRSETSGFYAIKNMREAVAYLTHPVLGYRLIEICNALLTLESNNANGIFGSPDDLKLKSSMTLFSLLPDTHPIFGLVLDKFFKGSKDEKTVQLMGVKEG